MRLIGEDGKQIGVVGRDEMLSEAKKAGLDAVEVVAKANPPVVRLIEYSKFKYQEEKKEREQRKKERKATEQKEIRFSPFIGEGDFEVRMDKIRDFLKEGHKVRIVVVFRGRQMVRKDFGYKLIEKVLSKLSGEAKLDQEPRFLGLRLNAVIAAERGGKKHGESKTEN